MHSHSVNMPMVITPTKRDMITMPTKIVKTAKYSTTAAGCACGLEHTQSGKPLPIPVPARSSTWPRPSMGTPPSGIGALAASNASKSSAPRTYPVAGARVPKRDNYVIFVIEETCSLCVLHVQYAVRLSSCCLQCRGNHRGQAGVSDRNSSED